MEERMNCDSEEIKECANELLMPDESQGDNCEKIEASEQDRNIFDRIGDFFFKMVKGIFIFAFLKLPRIIWECVTCIEYLRFILQYTKSVLRAVFWMVLWLVIVFAAWMAFGWNAFVKFWTAVAELLWDLLLEIWSFVYGNFGTIWMIIALIGSAYGLVYVSIRRRRQRRQSVSNDVVGQQVPSDSTEPESANETGEGSSKGGD